MNIFIHIMAVIGTILVVLVPWAIGITGIITNIGFSTNISGINASNITNGILNSNLLSTNINQPSGIGTFNLLYANLVGIATTALNLAANANIDISSINSGYSNLGVTTATTLDASTISASTSIGIGTDSPNSELHLRKNGSDTNVQITSDSISLSFPS